MTEDRKKDAKWYVVHTYSGHENKVKATLEKMVENRGNIDDIYEIVVPMENYYDKDNPSKVKQRKSYPGYVLINMIVDDDSWYLVRNTRGVTGFVGPGGKPVALTDRELKSLGMIEEVEKKPVDVKAGDRVLIMSGGFKDQVGTVSEVDEKARRLILLIDMFGRQTSADVDFDQVEKI
ncbi:MAG: transcription termination/antitermination protein NusG [Ezakiella sp.]|nr:transcription termination/antitermination protein NusG [Ezakiella sp.]MDD7471362.1 transcription termination/antitermination protein NusG [Bacillota bacterium]MDY3923543.1 transcription termination/antitermination protein NusG [Ezakiella sp.]